MLREYDVRIRETDLASVGCLDHALDSADGTSTLALQDSRLHVELDGATTKVSLEATTGKNTSQSRIHMLEVRPKTLHPHDDLLRLDRPPGCASGWALHAVLTHARSRSA
jgi:hypothetical protein